jgi:hypothetical protein
MNTQYLMVERLLKDNFAASINSYESLPVRTSSDSLITHQPDTDNEKYENSEEYPFMTVDKIHNKLTRLD